MAYNHDNSIIIVDTQNWAVKKTLTDEKVLAREEKKISPVLNLNDEFEKMP